MYVSCTSHGACGGTTPGTLTGQPDLMLDETATNELAYPLTLKQAGASAGLYYETMYAYDAPYASTTSTNPWANQYFFAGNGDGNLLYPGIQTTQAVPSPLPTFWPSTGQAIGLAANQPVSSVRLKLLRASSYLVDYVTLTGTAIPSSLIASPNSWSKNAADYQTFKNQMATNFTLKWNKLQKKFKPKRAKAHKTYTAKKYKTL